jgi:thiol-disulfide isomerase/thioredoxin
VCNSATEEGDSTPVPQEGWWTKNVPDNIVRVSTVQELVDELADASRNDQLVVLEVFAPWCGACKALFHKMKKLCKEHEDVKFLLLNFEDNRKMAKGLGVKVLPFFHFYRGPSGKVGEMTCSISKINKLKEAIMVHKSERCYLNNDVNDVMLREYPDITPSNMTSVSSAPEETLAV